MKYLEGMVAEQNGFRSKPISVDEWVKTNTKGTSLSKRTASKAIKDLKFQNQKLNDELKAQTSREGVGKFRGEIRVSDIRSFYFCERSAHYSVLQYPNQNIVETGLGKEIHYSYSDTEGRVSKKPSRTLEFIKKFQPEAYRIEWVTDSHESTLRHQTLSLSGRPDGIIHYIDGTKAILELKTVGKLPQTAWESDFFQVETYSLLTPTKTKLRDENVVLYMERLTREFKFFKRRMVMTEYTLAQVVAKIERGARVKEELAVKGSKNKCKSCGYRSICSDRLS